MGRVMMPKLSDTMEEGTVLEWRRADGDTVATGEVLAEVESDKAAFEIEAESDGVLHVVVEPGRAVPVGALIATIGEEAPAEAPAGPAPAAAPGTPKAPPVPEVRPAPATVSAAPTPPATSEGRIKVSPVAARLAAERGIDLRGVTGTGPGGRIVRDDVLAAQPGASAPAPAPLPSPETEVLEPSRMQSTIARRMLASHTSVPDFTVTVEARVDAAVSLREQLRDNLPGAERVTMTDFITRAAGIALTRFPEVNASWVDGRFERRGSISIGLAVAPAEGMGLLVPVVHDVDRKDLVRISIEARQVIERARSGRPAEGDLSGATFSISNLGMYGVDEFTAIVNTPEAAILAVGAIREAPVVETGRLAVGKLMRMTLSVDHRVFYGATAARFMAELKRLLENPVLLVLPPE